MERLPAHDTLYLWWLGQPAAPVLIGTLRFVPSLRGVSLHYAPTWLQQGFPLSEDLPLIDQAFLPLQKDVAVGAVDDARPDRWGERVIRFIDRPMRSSLMEFLYLAGDERFGALGVSTSASAHCPACRMWACCTRSCSRFCTVSRSASHCSASLHQASAWAAHGPKP